MVGLHETSCAEAQVQCCHHSSTLDLNIIENVWIDLKQAVYAQKPRNVTELEAFCMEEWPRIPPARHHGLACGNWRCLQAVIAAKGRSTKY